MGKNPAIGEKVLMSDMAKLFPNEYVFATKVDNNHPDFPNNFWIYYVDHCAFENREVMWKKLLEQGYHTHWYRTTPNREFTSVGFIGSLQ